MPADRLTLDLDRPTFDQQPQETDRAYQVFLAYRNLPAATRTLRLAAAEFYGEATEGNVRYVKELSRLNRWPERVHDFDVQEANRIVEELRAGIVNMRTRHAQIASVALSKVVEKLATINVDAMSVRDMTYLLDIAVKVERLSRGDSCDSVQGQQVADDDRVVVAWPR